MLMMTMIIVVNICIYDEFIDIIVLHSMIFFAYMLQCKLHYYAVSIMAIVDMRNIDVGNVSGQAVQWTTDLHC